MREFQTIQEWNCLVLVPVVKVLKPDNSYYYCPVLVKGKVTCTCTICISTPTENRPVHVLWFTDCTVHFRTEGRVMDIQR